MQGCIPVIIQDEIETEYEAWLDGSRLWVRVPENQLERLEEVLRAIPNATVAAMQAAVATELRARLTYSSVLRRFGADGAQQDVPSSSRTSRTGRG